MKKKELKRIIEHKDKSIQQLNEFIRTLLEGTNTKEIEAIRELYSRMDKLKEDMIFAATFPASRKMSGVVPHIQENNN